MPGVGLVRNRARTKANIKELLFPTTLDLAHGPLLSRFLKTPVVVLSAHFDDACFSLGGLLETIHQGTLINVFTAGRYLAKPRKESPQEADVFIIRDAEDEQFAHACGLCRIDLKCKEPALYGRHVGDLSGVAADLEQIMEPVLQAIAKIAAGFREWEKGYLFVPLGIGHHCNHRALNELILQNLDAISQNYEVLFYEDQPYAASPFNRLTALLRVARRLDTSITARYVLRNDWAQKKSLIEFYPTQLRTPPRRWRFRPAALSPLSPHEAFWTFPLNGAPHVAE
ncbi:hypothetical protein GCM10008941_06580 [Rhizomicrobium palustre]